jgi:hypothetical protein
MLYGLLTEQSIGKLFSPGSIPGITEARSIRAWDPPFPLDLRRIRPKDEDYWNRYRATPKAFITMAKEGSTIGGLMDGIGTLTSMALSGMLIPVDSFPESIQTIAKFVPMYYANKLFEGIMLKGYGISNLAPQFIIIGGIALLFFVLAVVTVKDRMVHTTKIRRRIISSVSNAKRSCKGPSCGSSTNRIE